MVEQAADESLRCETCGGTARPTEVQVTMWNGGQLVLIESVPAMVCESCGEQFYEENVATGIRKLAETGFAGAKAAREITVPVFRLDKGRDQ